jgi:hypothetical protein
VFASEESSAGDQRRNRAPFESRAGEASRRLYRSNERRLFSIEKLLSLRTRLWEVLRQAVGYEFGMS